MCSELPLFKAGFEYIISHNQPPDMFVIQRRDIRPSDGSRDNVTGAWFILEGKIYPTPTLYEVMANRLVSGRDSPTRSCFQA